MTETVVRQIVGDLFLQGDQSTAIPADTDLMQAGVFDSLGLVELTAALEEKFPGVRIPDQDVTAANFCSIRGITAYLAKSGAE